MSRFPESAYELYELEGPDPIDIPIVDDVVSMGNFWMQRPGHDGHMWYEKQRPYKLIIVGKSNMKYIRQLYRLEQPPAFRCDRVAFLNMRTKRWMLENESGGEA